MDTMLSLLDEPIKINGEVYPVKLGGYVDEANNEIIIQVIVNDPGGQEICQLDIKMGVTNPIEWVAIAMTVAGKYGLCVGVGLVGATGKLVYEAYHDSNKNNVELPPLERCKDTLHILSKNTSGIKKGVGATLVGCVASMSKPFLGL